MLFLPVKERARYDESSIVGIFEACDRGEFRRWVSSISRKNRVGVGVGPRRALIRWIPEMKHTRYVSSWLVYGIVVIASGFYRYFARPDGEKGLYFGLAMGALSIAAAALLQSGRYGSGHVAGFSSAILVTGWFVFEALIKDGGNHEVRLLLVAGLSVIQFGIAVAHLRGRILHPGSRSTT